MATQTRSLPPLTQRAWHPLAPGAPLERSRQEVKEGYALCHFQGLGDSLHFSEVSAHSSVISLEPADGHGDGGRPPPTDDVWA